MSEASSVSDEFVFRGSIADVREWGLRQPVVGRCAFCPDFEVHGNTREVHELSLAHQAEAHPELGKKKRRRTQPNLMRWRTSIDQETSAEIQQARSKRMKALGIPQQETAP